MRSHSADFVGLKAGLWKTARSRLNDVASFSDIKHRPYFKNENVDPNITNIQNAFSKEIRDKQAKSLPDPRTAGGVQMLHP